METNTISTMGVFAVTAAEHFSAGLIKALNLPILPAGRTDLEEGVISLIHRKIVHNAVLMLKVDDNANFAAIPVVLK